MLKLLSSFKRGLRKTGVKKYFAIYLLAICNFAFFQLLQFLSQTVSPRRTIIFGIIFVMAWGWLLLVLPSCLIAYGIISYRKTKTILLPNLMLFLTLSLIAFVKSIATIFWFPTIELLRPFIMTIFSLIVSAITAKVQKSKNDSVS